MLARVSARRTIRAWMVYDFANSAFAAIVQATVFPAFYANVVVGNAEGRGDFWWGTLVSVSMVLVALSSPLLGGIADHAGVRKPFFVALTALSVVATASLATLGPGMVRSGFVLGVLGLVTLAALCQCLRLSGRRGGRSASRVPPGLEPARRRPRGPGLGVRGRRQAVVPLRDRAGAGQPPTISRPPLVDRRRRPVVLSFSSVWAVNDERVRPPRQAA